jgi:methylated-DNA-[protein]-cysteine S-methyltransferase
MNECYTSFQTPFGEMSIVWKETNSQVLVNHIFLSKPQQPAEQRAMQMYPEAESAFSPPIADLVTALQAFLRGDAVEFDFKVLDWSQCSETQKRVLHAEAGIPRGWISTYKRIAQHIGIANGARMVGNALARNPFPLVIPCHRAVKSDGTLGGYQGGLEMKRKLLENEGVLFTSSGKVVMKNVYY